MHMVENVDTQKSMLSYLMIFSGRVVLWQLKLQKCIAISLTKVEYIAIIEVNKEVLWLKNLLKELG